MATKISFIKATCLHNVVGRIDYISNPKRQEHLLAFCDTAAEPDFWQSLSDVSQQHAHYHKGKKVVEAREHVVQLPNDLVNGDHNAMAQELARRFKRKYGVECAVGIHLNKTGTNYHAHIVFSERRLLIESEPSIATRNTYFDADGKRSNKSKCIGADGKLLPGCRLVKKGEAFSKNKFAGKDNKFFTRTFMKEEKERYAEYFSSISKDEWIVYNYKSNPHMSYLNLKRGEPEGLRMWKERENLVRKNYNDVIDRMMENGLSVEEALKVKQKVYELQKEEKERRAQEKVELQNWYARRRENWEERQALLSKYTPSGRRRGLIELTVILVMVIAGIGPFKPEEPRPVPITIKQTNPRIKELADGLYRAAGKVPPSERAAEERINRMLKGIAEDKPEEIIWAKEVETAKPAEPERKPSLFDSIASAEQESQRLDKARRVPRPRHEQEFYK